jgi:hypothetical protein
MQVHSRPASPSDHEWYHSEGDDAPIKPQVPQRKESSMTKAAPSVSAPSASRPKRTVHPSNKIVDPANAAKASLASHQRAIEARRIAEADATAMAHVDEEDLQLISQSEVSSAPTPAPTTVASSPEPPSVAKRTSPTTDRDSDSDNGREPVRVKHCRFYLVLYIFVINFDTQASKRRRAQ